MSLNIPTILPKEITDKYNIIRNSFIRKDKGEEHAELEVEVGDSKQDNFYPQFKIINWENETNFSVRLIDDETDEPEIQTEGNKIKFIKNKIEAHFYNLTKEEMKNENGGYEFEIILKEKPATNKIQMSIETKGLNFYYQPKLTQKEKDNGCHRPKNVIGSYAVYHESKAGDYSKMGLKNYRAGKAFHIYRPKIIDSVGMEVWGKLNIDIKKKLLTVEIPQEFLDNAVYPVRHAAGLEFGFNQIGTSFSPDANYVMMSEYSCPENGTATELSGYIEDENGGGNQKIKFAIYKISNNALIGYTEEGTVAASFKDWKPLNIVSGGLLEITDYYLASWRSGSTDDTNHYYDNTGGTSHYDAETYGESWPDPVIPTAWGTKRFSIYCTYSEAVTTETVTIIAKARIQKIITTTINSKVNIKKLGITKTIQVKARIQISGINKSIYSKTRIQLTESKSIQVKANLLSTINRDIQTKTRIKVLSVSYTIQVKASIKITQKKSIQTKVRIKILATAYSIQSKASIQILAISKTVQVKANIIPPTKTKTVNTKANIEKIFNKEIQTKSNLLVTQKKTIQSKTNLLSTINKNIQAKARIIILAISYEIQAKARIEINKSKTIQTKARIEINKSKTIQTKANLLSIQGKTIHAKVNILSIINKGIQAKARIKILAVSYIIQTKARIQIIKSKLIQAKAKIEISKSKTIQTKTNLSVTQKKTIQSKTNLLSIINKDIQVKARIKILSVNYAIQTLSRIERTENKSIQAKARIEISKSKAISALVNIFVTQEKTISAKARIIGATEKYIQAKANIFSTEDKNIQAKANITIKRIAYPWQRKHWYDGVRYWRASYDPANDRIMFEYSPDLSSWTENVSARISDANVSSDFSIWGNGSYLYIVYSNGEDILGRKAKAYPAINFVWFDSNIIYDGSDDLGKYTYPNIAYDGNENRLNVLATLQLDANNNYILYNKRALGANQVPSEATAKHELVASQADEVFGTIRRNTDAVIGSLIAVWKKGTAIQSAYRNGTDNANDWEADQDITTGKAGTIQAICAEHSQTGGDTVLIYIDSDGKAHSKNRLAGSGQSWNEEGVLDDDTNCRYPCIGEHAVDHFHLIWLDNDDHIRERIYDVGIDTWNPILANPPSDRATKPGAKWLIISDETPRIHCCWEEPDNSIDCLELLFNAEPTKPTDLESEGVTNPFGVTDLTPELTGLFHDTDTGDKSRQYQIEVRTSVGSFVSAFQLTDLENMAVSGVSFGANGKITVYGLGDVNPEGGYLESGGFTDSNVFSEARNILIIFNDIVCLDGATITLTYDGSQTLIVHLHAMSLPDEHGGFITNDGSAWHDSYFSILGYANPTTQWLISQADFSIQPGDGERCEDISYNGNALILDGSKYYWKIRMKDLAGAWSPWSDESASFQMASEKNIQAKANIKAYFNKAIQTKTRIKILSVTHIVEVKGNIKTILEKTIYVKARIAQLESKIIQAKVNILTALIKSIQATGNIRAIIKKTIEAKGRIWVGKEKYINVKANIKQKISKIINALTRVEISKISTIQANTRITRFKSRTINAVGNIRQTNESSISVKANIKITVERQILTKSTIIIVYIKTIYTKARVAVLSNTRSIQAIGAIFSGFIETVNAKARIQRSEQKNIFTKIYITRKWTQTISAKANIKQLNVNKIINAKGKIKIVKTVTIISKAKIKAYFRKIKIKETIDIKFNIKDKIDIKYKIKDNISPDNNKPVEIFTD